MDESFAVYVGLALVTRHTREIVPDDVSEVWCESCWEKNKKIKKEKLFYERVLDTSENRGG